MYYRDYTQQEPDVGEAIKHNHKTKHALIAKIVAKMQGKGGRLRGKNGAQENNKARGGKMAR